MFLCFIQDSLELSDDVSLKKLLKERTKEKKKANFIAAAERQAAEVEMERLCKIKGRLETMRQKILDVRNDKAKNSGKSDLHGESVIYVPVAELREKP